MVPRKPTWSLLLVALLLSLPGFVVQAFGQEPGAKGSPCSQATLVGTYSGSLEGTIIAQLPGFPPPPLPYAESTMHIYDGAGHFSGEVTPSLNGVILPSTFTGTYTVTPDCTYSGELKTASGVVIRDVGIISGNGAFREIQEIWSLPVGVVSGTLKQAPPEGCSLASLKGTYGFLEHGTNTVQLPGFPPPPVPFVGEGTITYDGNGNASLNFTTNIDGQTISSPATGTYTVSHACKYTDQLTSSSGLAFTDTGTITGVGRFQEVHYVNSGGGFVSVGTVKK
jgi:hypothetical protein